MKTLGVIGGIGPESTVEYYRSIISLYRERKRDGSYPALILNSIDMQKMLALIGADDLAGVTEYLLGEVKKLASAGADLGLLASNTPHIVFGELCRRSPLPLISIVETACEVVKDKALKRVGLFGTRFTMQGAFYPEVFSRERIALVVPNEEEQAFIHAKYMSELVNGIFLAETRARMLAIMDRLRAEEGIQGLILGGTELPLLLRDEAYKGMPLFDTTKIHVAHAVVKLLS